MLPNAIQEMDFSKSEQSILSIRISTDGFYFSIYNPLQTNPFHFFKAELDKQLSLVANFKNLVAVAPFLSQLYKKVNIVIANTKSVLHPLHLFDESFAKELFYFGQKLISTNNIVMHNKLIEHNQAVIFGINDTLHTFLNQHFGQPVIYSQTTCLLRNFNKEAKENRNKSMFIYFENSNLQVYAYNKEKLLLNNVFKTNEINNQIYYILYCWKQLKFSQENDSLYLYGEVKMKEEIVDTIRKYIISVSIDNNSEYIDLKNINL